MRISDWSSDVCSSDLQGLNLGLRDVAALAECIVDARRLGLDVGDATVLERSQRWSLLATMPLVAPTASLNRLFPNDLPPLHLLRRLRSHVRRVGKECVSTGCSRWWRVDSTKKFFY